MFCFRGSDLNEALDGAFDEALDVVEDPLGLRDGLGLGDVTIGLGLDLFEDLFEDLGLRDGLGLGDVTTDLGLDLLEDPLCLRGGLGVGNVTVGLGLDLLEDLLLLRVALGLGDLTFGFELDLLGEDDEVVEDEEELECQESMLTGFGGKGANNVSVPEGVDV